MNTNIDITTKTRKRHFSARIKTMVGASVVAASLRRGRDGHRPCRWRIGVPCPRRLTIRWLMETRTILIVTLLMGASVLSDGRDVAAQVAGEWTRCIALSRGTAYNIVNGEDSPEVCHALAIRCTNDLAVVSRHYSNWVIINAPYLRCDMW